MQKAIGQPAAWGSSVPPCGYGLLPGDQISLRFGERKLDPPRQLTPNSWKFKRLTGIMQIEDKGEAGVGSEDAGPLQDPGRAGPRRDGRGVPRHRSADRARGRAQDAASRAADGGA